MAISIFEPRVMRAALYEMKPPRNFLRSLFFSTVETQLTEKVDVDIYTGVRRMAPFVNPVGVGKVVDRLGFTTSTVTPPLVAPKKVITIPDLQTRTPGEHVYSNRDPNDRMGEILRGDLMDSDQMIARKEEWMCAQALFASAIVVSGDDVGAYTITYPRDATLDVGTLTGSNAWTHADANIYKNIRDWRRAIVKLSGATPSDMVCSPEAIDAFIKSPGIIGSVAGGGILNVLRADLGNVSPQLRDMGATFWGQLAGTGINIWTYDEWYVDPADGVEKPIVPAKKILLGCANARTAMRYGAVGVKSGVGEGANIGLVADSRVPQSWVEEEPPVRFLKLSSRPLPVPIQNNAFLTAQVVA